MSEDQIIKNFQICADNYINTSGIFEGGGIYIDLPQIWCSTQVMFIFLFTLLPLIAFFFFYIARKEKSEIMEQQIEEERDRQVKSQTSGS